MTVSVIIAAFNVAQTIERALESAVNQTLPPLEVLVVDDASTDSTRETVRSLGEQWPTVKLIELPKNKGPSGARNAGLDAANGDWIAILDADDAWKPNRLKTLTWLGDSNNSDFIADNVILFDWVANREGRKGFEVEWPLKRLSPRDLFESALPDSPTFSYGLLKPLIRRSFLRKSGIRYDEEIRYAEDFLFYAEILFSGASALLSSDAMYVYTTRIGEFSGKRSIHSKSVPRFDLVGEVNDCLERKYEKQIDHDFRRIIARRRARLRAVHLANVAREYRTSRRYFHYIVMVVTHTDLLLLLLLRMRDRLLRALCNMKGFLTRIRQS